MILEGEAFMRMTDAVRESRTEDFVRYVSRQLREQDHLAHLSFRDGWYTMLGGYLQLVARDDT